MIFRNRKAPANIVVGYVRVSTEQQERYGVSLDAQRDAIAAYCERNGLILLDTFCDVSTGANNEREGLAGAFGCLDLGVAGGLVVVRIDRISRDSVFLGTAMARYFGHKSGCKLYSVDTGEVTTHTATGDFMVNIHAAVAQYERKIIGERTRQALQRVKAEGGRMGKAPLGYKYSNELDEHGRRKLVEDPAAMAVVRAVREAREEGLSYTKIAQLLKMHKTQVARVLSRC